MCGLFTSRTEISDQEKLACAERELAMRRVVYRGQVKRGVLAPTIARREIEVMEAIAADYRAKVQPL
jgi:hypothetical protein